MSSYYSEGSDPYDSDGTNDPVENDGSDDLVWTTNEPGFAEYDPLPIPESGPLFAFPCQLYMPSARD